MGSVYGGTQHVGKGTNTLLTSLYLAEVGGIFAYLLHDDGVLPRGSPVGGHTAAGALVATCVVVQLAIVVIKSGALRCGAFISRTLLASFGDPLRKPKSLHKFTDQSWQLFVHSTMTALEARADVARAALSPRTRRPLARASRAPARAALRPLLRRRA